MMRKPASSLAGVSSSNTTCPCTALVLLPQPPTRSTTARTVMLNITRRALVRNHFQPPTIDLARWRLRVEGCVEKTKEWTLDELLALPERTVFATVECAGNGRSFLQTRVPGVPWGAGAIGHAEWTGVPLRLVLEQAGLRPGAVEVLCEGCDRGSEADHPELMNFQRSLPLTKA